MAGGDSLFTCEYESNTENSDIIGDLYKMTSLELTKLVPIWLEKPRGTEKTSSMHVLVKNIFLKSMGSSENEEFIHGVLDINMETMNNDKKTPRFTSNHIFNTKRGMQPDGVMTYLSQFGEIKEIGVLFAKASLFSYKKNAANAARNALGEIAEFYCPQNKNKHFIHINILPKNTLTLPDGSGDKVVKCTENVYSTYRSLTTKDNTGTSALDRSIIPLEIQSKYHEITIWYDIKAIWNDFIGLTKSVATNKLINFIRNNPNSIVPDENSLYKLINVSRSIARDVKNSMDKDS